MKYLKHFETEAEYIQFKNSEDFVLPNISYIEEINGVMFNSDVALASPNLVCVYDIVDTSRETQIISSYASYAYTSMIVDGVEMDFDCYYQFDTEGLHTVEFVFDENYNTEIPNYGFNYITQLISVIIPNSVTLIGENAFDGCSSLTKITIPNSVTSLIGYVFYNCSSLPVVDNVRYADTYLVEVTNNTLNTYNIKDNTKFIGTSAFAYCSGLNSIIIPDSVTYIDDNAFKGCSKLTSITLGNSVTSIDDSAFYGCSELTSITIPDSVTSIGNSAFSECSNLTSVYCKATTPPTGKSGMFSDNASDRKIYVPMESVEVYKSAEDWKYYADAIEGYNF